MILKNHEEIRSFSENIFHIFLTFQSKNFVVKIEYSELLEHTSIKFAIRQKAFEKRVNN